MNEFEIAMVDKPLMFQPSKFQCISELQSLNKNMKTSIDYRISDKLKVALIQ